MENVFPIIKSFTFKSKEEKLAFEREIQLLLKEKSLSNVVGNHTLSSLYNLYLTLCGDDTDILVALGRSIPSLSDNKLQGFLSNLLDQSLTLPTQSTALEVFLHLCAKQLEEYYTTTLLELKVLEICPPHSLQIIRKLPFQSLYILIDALAAYGANFSEREKLLLVHLLDKIQVGSLDELSPLHLKTFIKEYLPAYVERFEQRISQARLFYHPKRIAAWYQVWRNHLLKLEEIEDEEYYAMDFKTIIQYVPEFIWWSNGLQYQHTVKKFDFGSEGFIHLAKGGSIRKASNNYPFTRRMSKVFVNLPFNFDQTGKNMYIYCYGESLDAGPLLKDMMQEFVRHPTHLVQLQEELDKWNPVIQKMACDEFEALTREQAVAFMGYLYHCLRDQPNFTVQRRRFEQIYRDGEAYHDRIQQRVRQQQERRRQQRRAYEEREARDQQLQAQAYQRLEAERQKLLLLTKWSPHSSVKTFSKGKIRIIELTNRRALHQEAIAMSHCVGSYAYKCLRKECSIWSLREWVGKKEYSRVTIEVDRNKTIVQTSARFNAVPEPKYMKTIEEWAAKYKLRI